MPLRECAAGSGLEVSLEVRRGRSVGKLHGNENPPRTMRNSLARRAFVVPSKSFINVRGAADIVARRIALTSEDVYEALADAFHDESSGISRARENAVNFVKQSRTET
jgi:hypothetical protein